MPVTLAGELIRRPWIEERWDGQALLVLIAMLVGSLGLTAWRLHRETEN